MLSKAPQRWLLLMGTATLLTLLAAACGSPQPTPGPTPTTPPTTAPSPTPAPSPTSTAPLTPTTAPPAPSPTADPIAMGQQLFVSTGCSACHGNDAQGTSMAPGLPGHTESLVRRQVRAPLGLMPAFPPDKISQEELAAIAAYVASLGGGHLHEREDGAGEEMVMHHWMALFALEDENTQEAAHHIRHIMELVTGDHLARMKEALAVVEAGGDLHDAAHIVENMLAGTAAPGLTEATMHLQMALSALRVEDTTSATHHLEHVAALTTVPEHETGEALLALLQAGAIADAEHELAELLGDAGEEEGHAEDAHEDDHQEG